MVAERWGAFASPPRVRTLGIESATKIRLPKLTRLPGTVCGGDHTPSRSPVSTVLVGSFGTADGFPPLRPRPDPNGARRCHSQQQYGPRVELVDRRLEPTAQRRRQGFAILDKDRLPAVSSAAVNDSSKGARVSHAAAFRVAQAQEGRCWSQLALLCRPSVSSGH